MTGDKLIFRMSEKNRAAWLAMCEARKISQVAAMAALIEWITGQDSVLQGMILGQQPADRDLAELVLDRLVASRPRLKSAAQPMNITSHKKG